MRPRDPAQDELLLAFLHTLDPSKRSAQAEVMERRLIRRATTAVVIAMAVVMGGGRAFAMYRCAYDNIARTSCCCPTKAKQQKDLPTSPTLKAACCCSIEEVRTETTVAAKPAPSPLAALAPTATIVPVIEPIVAHIALAPTDREARPPPRSASLFEQRISFLV